MTMTRRWCVLSPEEQDQEHRDYLTELSEIAYEQAPHPARRGPDATYGYDPLWADLP